MSQRGLRRHGGLALLCLLSWTLKPAVAQNPAPNLASLMDGTTAPLTLVLKDLDADWRRFVLSGGDGITPGLNGSVFYTRGRTMRAGETTFLVAYQLGLEGPDLGTIMRPFQGLPAKEAGELTPDTPLVLALLNLDSMGDFQFIEQVDVQQEIKTWHEVRLMLDQQVARAVAVRGGRGGPDQSDASLLNLVLIGQALQSYEGQHEGVLPPLTDPQELSKALVPLLGDASALLQPGSKTPYAWNTILSQQDSHNFTGAAGIVVCYEAKPAAGTQRGVLFMDGQAKRVSEAEWKRLQATSLMK